MLRLRNTLTGEIEEVPTDDGRVRMYSCGPTVYRPSHIGNMRSYLLPDLIARAVRYHGIDVYRLMNITDVGHMTDELSETQQAEYQKSIPMGRFATPVEVAKVVTWLAGDDAGYISGAVIPVDGGLGMGH